MGGLQEHEGHDFVHEEVIRREYSMGERLQEFFGKPDEMSLVNSTVCSGKSVASPSNTFCEMMAII